MSLNEAKECFLKVGAKSPDSLAYVRGPTPDEMVASN